MGTESYIGEIALYPYYGGIPDGWVPCEGQSLSINDTANQPLFAVIGSQFGGDGQTTFNLPDLRGMTVIGAGANPVLSPRSVGDKVGSETVKLNAGHVGHSHGLFSSGQVNPNMDKTNAPRASSNLGALSVTHPGAPSTAEFSYAVNTPRNKRMQAGTIGTKGGDKPHENRQPFLALRYCICVAGLYPQ